MGSLWGVGQRPSQMVQAASANLQAWRSAQDIQDLRLAAYIQEQRLASAQEEVEKLAREADDIHAIVADTSGCHRSALLEPLHVATPPRPQSQFDGDAESLQMSIRRARD